MKPSTEDVNALLADTASQQKKSHKKNSKNFSSSGKSSKKRVPRSEDSKTLSKKYLEPPKPFPNNTKEDRTNADVRLSEFMRGERCICIEGEDHFYDPEAMHNYTLEEVGSVMGVTRERVRQIEETALRKMWRALDIMGKREGVSKDEWMAMLNNGNHGEDTIYMP